MVCGKLAVYGLLPLFVGVLSYAAVYSLNGSSPTEMIGQVLLRFAKLRFPPPSMKGKRNVSGLVSDTVTIVRDNNGLAYIFGDTEQDMLFGQGYACATDRLWQVTLLRMISQGRTSEWFGVIGMESDIQIRTLNITELARQDVSYLDPTTRQMMESYNKGMNAAFTALGPSTLEHWMLGIKTLDPWTIEDTLGVYYYCSYVMNKGWDKSLALAILKKLMPSAYGYFIYDAGMVPPINPESPNALFRDINGEVIPAPDAGKYTPEWRDYLKLGDVMTPEMAKEPQVIQDVSIADTHVHTQATGNGQTPIKGDGSTKPIGGSGSWGGSNAWSVSGKYTKNGGAYIAGDMHLSQSAPAFLYPVFMTTDPEPGVSKTKTKTKTNTEKNGQGGATGRAEGVTGEFSDDIRLVGLGLPGIPGIFAGHNKYIGMATTLSFIQLDDIFSIELNNEKTHYIFDKELKPIVRRRERIFLDQAKTRAIDVNVDSTHLGPIVSDLWTRTKSLSTDKKRVVLSSIITRSRCTSSLLRVYRCRTWECAYGLTAGNGCISLSMTYGDIYGNIGNFFTAHVPRRPITLTDGLRDGTTSAYDWAEWVPREEIPHILNPRQGYLATANSVSCKDCPAVGYTPATGERQKRLDKLLSARILCVRNRDEIVKNPKAYRTLMFPALDANDTICEGLEDLETNGKPHIPEAQTPELDIGFEKMFIMQQDNNDDLALGLQKLCDEIGREQLDSALEKAVLGAPGARLAHIGVGATSAMVHRGKRFLRALTEWDGYTKEDSRVTAVIEIWLTELTYWVTESIALQEAGIEWPPNHRGTLKGDTLRQSPAAWATALNEIYGERTREPFGIRATAYEQSQVSPFVWFNFLNGTGGDSETILKKTGGKPYVMMLCLIRALLRLQNHYGPYNEQAYEWKNIHRFRWQHGFELANPVLAPVLAPGPQHSPGTGRTLAASKVGLWHPEDGDVKQAFEAMPNGPGNRAVMDAGDWKRSRWLIMPGVSGWPTSPHYRDQAKLYENNQYLPMIWTDQDILANKKFSVILHN